VKIKSTYLIGFQAILFFVFLLITFFFNRFAADDYYFIGELRTMSFKEIYKDLYFNWHGRWTSNFLLVLFLKFNQVPLFLMLYNTLSLGLLYIGVVRLLKAVNIFYTINIERKTILTFGLVFISVLFFCTISANDSWLWYTSSIVYLWSTIAFFFGFSTFFKEKKKFLDCLILILSTVYIGGSNEPLTFIILLLLLFLVLKKHETIISSLTILILISAFLINYLSPGTLHRDQMTPDLSFVNLIFYTGYSSIKFLLFSIHTTLIPALFLSIPFYLLGKKSSFSIAVFHPINELIKSIVIVISIVIINQFIVVYALGSLSPDRSGVTSTIAIAIIMIRYLFLLGTHHQNKYNQLKKILFLNVIALIIFNFYFANIHSNYATAVDNRIQYISISKSELIKVDPLPSSGYIYSTEITTDATNFKNQHLKNGLGIKNDIVLTD
jgi:hypothetical protein